ncbi:MAG: 50S ribosomal protein L17 [Crocinitomicaceae bacterium TMED16]|nr:MAG: 50S ribosomal protein L17 [Crocinitomicaceae bacterium TMED16]
MRHGKKVNHLSRKKGHRRSLLSNMACSLIEHKSINTTLAKAKALRVYVEPLLTKSKTDSTHSRRTVFSYLQDKDVVAELFREVAPKIATRNGGYTRIIRTGYRLGDNAEMCMIELVDFNEVYTKEAATKTTRRSRRGGKKSTNAETSIEEAVVTEEPTTEATEEPTTEATEETAAEATEEPAAEATEEPVAEATEEPAAEATEEPKAETPSEEESKEDDNSSEADKKEG